MRRRVFNKITVCILSIFAVLNIQAQVGPGVDFDLQGYIDQKISDGETNIVIPPGRYRVSSNGNTAHLYFNDLNDITIIADNVEMICTETVQAIQINNCTNFKLKGLTVDYDPLPFTQARIVDLSSDKKTITAEIIDGYSTTVAGNKLEIYDPVTGVLSTTTYYGVTYQVDKEKRQIVISKDYGLNVSDEEVGDIAVLASEFGRSRPHIILPDNCTDLILEEVTLFSGPTFGFFEKNCSGSQYINCRIDRRPLSNDLKQRGFPRMRSINADGYHSKHATVGPKYIGCLARYNGDDGIAINGDYHFIASSNGNILSVVPKGGNDLNLSVGDSAELISYSGERMEDAQITEIEKGPALTSEVKEFLQNQAFSGAADNTYKASNIYYVTLDRPVDLPLGSLIASSNRIGNGFEVRNCIMGPNRSRGILVKASNGIITGNKLVGNWGDAIKLAPEYRWFEAGSGSNVIISNNDISGCHDAAIAVYAYGGNGETAPAGAHKNISITGNAISSSANPGIAVTSTQNLILNYNTIKSPDNDLLLPWRMSDFGRNDDPDRRIYLENVEIEENSDLLVLFKFDEESTATEVINTGMDTSVYAEIITSGGTITPGVTDAEEDQVLYANTDSNGEIALKDASGNYTGPTGGAPRTYSFWIKPDALESSTILYSGSETPEGQLFLIQIENNGVVSLTDNSGNVVKTSETINPGQWELIALTVPQNANIREVQFYVNGAPSVQTYEGTNDPVNTAADVFRLIPDYAGYIRDFRVYNATLTAEDILHIYDGADVEGVRLSETILSLITTQTWQLTPTVNPVIADQPAVSWSSDNTSVATVDANGLVTGVNDGTANITVATNDGGFTATCAVSVTTRVIDVSVSPSTSSLAPLETLQLTTTIVPEDAVDRSVTWSSSDESVATVDANGLVSAVADGTASITVTTNDRGLTASCEITVFTNVIGVSVNPTSLTLALFESAQLTATLSPANATNDSITWFSDNSSVAQVTDNGLVKGYADGTATITATTDDGNYTATCEVTVGTGINVGLKNNELKSIRLFPNPASDILNFVIDMEYEKFVVNIIDLSGRSLISGLLSGIKNTLDISSLDQGIYNVTLKDGDTIIYRERIVKV